MDSKCFVWKSAELIDKYDKKWMGIEEWTGADETFRIVGTDNIYQEGFSSS